MQIFGLVSKEEFIQNLVPLLAANGLDFKEALKNTKDLASAKANKAKAKIDEADKASVVAQVDRDIAVRTAELKLAEKVKELAVEYQAAAVLKIEAENLTKAAKYFSS